VQRLEDKLDRIAAAVGQLGGGGGGDDDDERPSQGQTSSAGDVSDAEAPRVRTNTIR
jgi:hypothetical protein